MQLLHGSPGGPMQGQYFCHILHITEGSAGISSIPAAAPEHRERWNKAGLGGVTGGHERDEARQEPRWSRHGWEPRPGCLCRCRCQPLPARRPSRHRHGWYPVPLVPGRPRLPALRAPAGRRAHRHASHTDTRTDAHKRAQTLT